MMAAVAERRQSAFSALLDKYMMMVSRTSYRILCDRRDSEEVTQEVFLHIWRNASDYDGSRTLPVWIYSITFRLCCRRLVRRSISDLFSFSDSPYETSAPEALSPEEDYITKETWEIFCRTSRNLSAEQRGVFVLYEMEGLSMEDLEKVTGMKSWHLKDCLDEVEVKLKIELGKYGKVR